MNTIHHIATRIFADLSVVKDTTQHIATTESVLKSELWEILTRCEKWITRLDERRADLPASFFDQGDPASLSKELRAVLGMTH